MFCHVALPCVSKSQLCFAHLPSPPNASAGVGVGVGVGVGGGGGDVVMMVVVVVVVANSSQPELLVHHGVPGLPPPAGRSGCLLVGRCWLDAVWWYAM